MTDFHKLSNVTSPARQADSTNAFPSPPGTQRNGDHCFLRREDWSRWISGPPTFSKWLKTIFWPIWQFTIFSWFSLPGPFWGPKWSFFEIEVLNDIRRHNWAPKMNLLDNTFPTSYHTPKTEIICKSYDPGKLMYSLTQTGPTWLLALHLLGLGFWMSMNFGILIYCKNASRDSL